MAMGPPPHIAILPSPGMGHLIPLGEFAKRLHLLHGVTATFILPTDGPLSDAQSAFFSALPAALDHVLLPPVNFDDLPADVKIETRISLTVTRSLPAIRDALASLQESRKVAAFVVDLFGTDGFDVAAELHIPPYIFFPSTAMALCLFLYLPELDKTTSCEYRDLPGKVQIPGSVAICGGELLDPVQDRKNEAYKWCIHHMKRYKMADGIALNSFKELEPGPIEYLLKTEEGKPHVYPMGPLINPMGPLIRAGSKPEDNDSCPCSKWLDDQPSGSVLYVSFGSGGTLSHSQIIELALGLEMSEQRFLWVLTLTNDEITNATYFHISNVGDPLAYLPEGFLERTKDRALVVPFWAPQATILAHKSTGVFLTHCGWNSTLESITNGVPLIAWPLFAEQKMNAVIIEEEAKIGSRVRVEENRLVGRAQIVNAVKGLMEGEEGKGVRSRMRELKDSAAKTLGENGASTKFLDELVLKWKSSTSM